MSIDNVAVFQDPDKTNSAPVVALPVLDEGGSTARVAPVLPPDFPENAVLQVDGSVLLTLQYPVTLRFRDANQVITEEPYQQLRCGRFNGKKLRAIRSADSDSFPVIMLMSMTDMTRGRAELLHDQMDAMDIAAMLKVGVFFITPGPRNGR